MTEKKTYSRSEIAEKYWKAHGFNAKYGKGHYIDAYFWYKLIWYLSDYYVVYEYDDDKVVLMEKNDAGDVMIKALSTYDVMIEEERFNNDIWGTEWEIKKLGAMENLEQLKKLRYDSQLASVTLTVLEDLDEKLPNLVMTDEITKKDSLVFRTDDGKTITLKLDMR